MSNDSLSDEDKELFRQAVKSVKPLKKPNLVKSVTKPPAITVHKKIVEHVAVPKEEPIHLSDFYTHEVQAQSILSFCQHSIPGKRLKELRQGIIPWQGKLDLHGLRQTEAQQALVNFILRAINNNQRCLLIIHGKGSPQGEAPVLKNLVNHWLKQIPQVLAFHSALPKDGGSGALYVLLKRNREF